MNRLLAIIMAIFAISFAFLDFPNGALAIGLVALLTLVGVFFIKSVGKDVEFLVNVFIGAVIIRLLLGGIIFYFDLFDFFGPDARGYDFLGQTLVDIWQGQSDVSIFVSKLATRTSGPGWGMNYLAGGLYFLTGRSILVAQSVCGFFGAAISPLVYHCTIRIYSNIRAARVAAVLIAFFPSFVVWTSQFLKDGLIIFLLVLAITLVLELRTKLNYFGPGLIAVSLFGIISLRFYIFYMAAAAIAGSFIIGLGSTAQSLIRGILGVAVIGLALTYLGVLQSASAELETYGNLDRLQISRMGAGQGSGSSFVDSDNVDVRTVGGAIVALPLGLAYLILAPFPWQASNFRQAVTIPEVLMWWALIPFAFTGLWYTLRHKLREAIPVLIFTLMLTLVYSVYQGNVGTAYRQRTQIQVFLFMFIAVGWVLMKEKRENVQLERRRRRELFEASLKGRVGQQLSGGRN